MADLGAYFGNPNLQRQGARARALVAQRDVNTLADPRTYAAVQGLLGTAPDQMGFSVLHPDYQNIKKVAEPAFALGLLGQASPLLAPLTKGLPVGASIKNVGQQGLLDIAKRDASDIFGAGAQRIKYTDPRSGGAIDVLARPDGTASVLGLEVPETFRGQGVGGLLQSRVLQDFPDMQGQVSSKAAATNAYKLGRRPPNMPDATLDDVYRMIDEDSSVNMISPQMQQRIAPTPETGLLGQEVSEYRGSHTAPNAKTYGATLDDLTKILPEDVYTQQGKQLYGIGDRLIDSEWRIAALKARGKPDAEIEVFRAVPKGVKTINDGDWVSTSKKYAKDHGENTLNGEYDIISKKVKAKTLSTEGYPYEYGYNEIPTAPRQEALDTAQRNAALPIEEGGLGLPKDNTPMDRAKAMGFDIDTFRYHGSDKDIYSFDPAKFGKNDQGWYGRGVTTDTDPEIASAYANYNEAENGQVVYPLLTRGKYMDWPEGQQPFASVKDSIQGTKDIQNLGYQGTRMTNDRDLYGDIPNIGTEQVTFNPANVRSRFAAFDPMRRNEADILAGVLPLGLLADEDQRKKLYELMPSLLGE
jgi:hypothetical protein